MENSPREGGKRLNSRRISGEQVVKEDRETLPPKRRVELRNVWLCLFLLDLLGV